MVAFKMRCDHHRMYIAGTVVCCLVITAMLCLSSRAADDKAAASEAPADLATGLTRLEKLLGRYDVNRVQQWRFIDKQEIASTPEPGKSIVTVSDGVQTYSTPYRSGDFLVFDCTKVSTRSVYDLGKSNQRTLSRQVETSSVNRYLLSRSTSGDWFFEMQLVSNSVPEFNGRPYESGYVKWLPDGLELVGTYRDEAFAAGGKLIPCVGLYHLQLTRVKNCLNAKTRDQRYGFLKDPDGGRLPLPDFSQPSGDTITSDMTSEENTQL
jgi:hypothetical protein